MKTQKEILQRIDKIADSDFFGVIRSDLICFLEFENAKPFLDDNVTEKEWAEIYKEPTPENIKAKMKEYLDFAFEKANGQRGLSAQRSMDHYSAWIWLLGEENYFGNVRQYYNYGLPHLNKIREYLADETDSTDQTKDGQ